MSQTANEIFIVGLRNAHSMETQARELMERQIERTGDYPEVQSRIRMHLDETITQLSRLEQCLEAFSESASTIKDTVQSILGNLLAMGHAVADDEILKNTFANNAFENFEIAAYRSLIAMADNAGATNAKPLLEMSLREEERMAQWVAESIEKLTQEYLAKQAA